MDVPLVLVLEERGQAVFWMGNWKEVELDGHVIRVVTESQDGLSQELSSRAVATVLRSQHDSLGTAGPSP